MQGASLIQGLFRVPPTLDVWYILQDCSLQLDLCVVVSILCRYNRHTLFLCNISVVLYYLQPINTHHTEIIKVRA